MQKKGFRFSPPKAWYFSIYSRLENSEHKNRNSPSEQKNRDCCECVGYRGALAQNGASLNSKALDFHNLSSFSQKFWCTSAEIPIHVFSVQVKIEDASSNLLVIGEQCVQHVVFFKFGFQARRAKVSKSTSTFKNTSNISADSTPKFSPYFRQFSPYFRLFSP